MFLNFRDSVGGFRLKRSKHWCLIIGLLMIANTNMLYAQSSAEVATNVRSAFVNSIKSKQINEADFKTMFNWLTSSSGKEKWREINWRHDLWDARTESAKVGKPIFIWAMNGDPLGCV